MKNDPFTLRVALSKAGTARGELYLDDGESYSHQQGQFIWREFVAKKEGTKKSKTLKILSRDLAAEKPNDAVDGVALKSFNPSNDYAKSIAHVRVEKIVLVGLSSKPSSVKVEGGEELVWEYTPGVSASEKKEGRPSLLTIKDPRVLVTKDWAIVVQ